MEAAGRLSVLVLDIDGVLTDGRVTYGPDGRETKSLSYHDLDAVSVAQRRGLRVALVTGEDTPWVEFVSQRIQVKHVVRGAKDKLAALHTLASALGVSLAEMCYVGDGDRDGPALAAVGLGLAPANATPRAKEAARLVLRAAGGQGAVREALEMLANDDPANVMAGRTLTPRSSDASSAVDRWPRIRAAVAESVAVQQAAGDALAPEIARAAEVIAGALRGGAKVLVFGNGGSAADAQHLAAELVGRYEHERPALAALALTTDTSILTALSNDYGAETVFARQLQALGRRGDVAIAISTSGSSGNVLAGVRVAREMGISTIGLSGQSGGRLRDLVDLCLCVPSERTARIQEAHALIIHLLCELVEDAVMKPGENTRSRGGGPLPG